MFLDVWMVVLSLQFVNASLWFYLHLPLLRPEIQISIGFPSFSAIGFVDYLRDLAPRVKACPEKTKRSAVQPVVHQGKLFVTLANTPLSTYKL